jgi:hypothetical protein
MAISEMALIDAEKMAIAPVEQQKFPSGLQA